MLAPVSVKTYLGQVPEEKLRLIAFCDEELDISQRQSIAKALAEYSVKDGQIPDIAILIGPEGDFSEEEVNLAMELGWTPVHIGSSRLRTETAAVTSVAAVYLRFLK